MNINATKLSEIIAPTRAKAGYRGQYQIQILQKMKKEILQKEQQFGIK